MENGNFLWGEQPCIQKDTSIDGLYRFQQCLEPSTTMVHVRYIGRMRWNSYKWAMCYYKLDDGSDRESYFYYQYLGDNYEKALSCFRKKCKRVDDV